jgi:hypothetical protein
MKRCPTCNRTFSDSNLSFCIDDGTPLIAVVDSAEDVTVVTPSNRTQEDNPPPTQTYSPHDWDSAAYQPPGSYIPPGGSTPRRRVWPWVIGILGALLIGIVGLGIVGAVLVPRMLKSTNRNPPVVNSNQSSENPGIDFNSNINSNLNANSDNSNANENANASDDASSVPTDEAEVLAALTSLEHDWTVANINADKSALDRILADDFVGSGPDGRAQGKAEYLRTIQRDTETQSWDFEDLKLSLNGTRATLSGIVKFQLRNGEFPFKFVDKFVWRDGRWQATASEVTRIDGTATSE